MLWNDNAQTTNINLYDKGQDFVTWKWCRINLTVGCLVTTITCSQAVQVVTDHCHCIVYWLFIVACDEGVWRWWIGLLSSWHVMTVVVWSLIIVTRMWRLHLVTTFITCSSGYTLRIGLHQPGKIASDSCRCNFRFLSVTVTLMYTETGIM